MAILVLALKCTGWLVVIALIAIVIILALPISLRGSCSLVIESNLEEALEMLDAEDPGDISLFLYDGTFELRSRALLGLLAVLVSESTCPELRILGIKVPLGKGSGSRVLDKSLKPGRAGVLDNPKDDEPDKPRKPRKGKKISLAEIKKYLSPPVRARVTGLLKSLYTAMHLDMDLDIEFGFFDPSHTGMVLGLVSALAGAFGLSGVRLYPNFEDQWIVARGAHLCGWYPRMCFS